MMQSRHSHLYDKLPDHQREAIAQYLKRREAERDARRKFSIPSPQLVRQKKALAEHLAKLVDPDLADKAREIVQQEKVRFRNYGADIPPISRFRSPPRVTDASMRWIASFPIGQHGIWPTVTGANTAQIGGKATYLSDDRVVFDIGVTGFYGMDPHHLLVFGETPPRWNSGPVATLMGYVYAWTGLQFILSYGDKWAKCRLKLHHEVFQSPPGTPPVNLGVSDTEVREYVNEENESRWVYNLIDMDSWLMPYAYFSLAFPNETVFALVEIMFEIELEGDAAISFGWPYEDAHQFENPMHIEIFEWTPLPWGT
jgi:hypothetical protein